MPSDSTATVAVRKLVQYMAATLNQPGRLPLQWTVVSPLATGADQIVAEAILELPNARLEVIAPLDLNRYRHDFQFDDERRTFESLLARAATIHELDERSDAADACSECGTRNLAYLRLGERVVEASEILIAIWNGRRAAGPGGTADTIRYALDRERIVLWIDPDGLGQPARLIQSISFVGEDDRARIRSTELPRTAKHLSMGYHQQTGYCLDDAVPADVQAECCRQAYQELTAVAAECGMPTEATQMVLSQFVPQFVRADQLAQVYQRRHIGAVNAILYLAGLAVSVGVAQVLFFSDHRWVILVEVLSMSAVLVVWLYSRHYAWHRKWLQNRYLAERLRLNMFVVMLGSVPESELRPPMPFYPGPQQWLATIVQAVGRSAGNSVRVFPVGPLKQFLVRSWLFDQRDFHARNAIRSTHRAHRRHAAGLFLFGGTLLMALLHLFEVGHGAAGGAATLRVDLWIVFLALVLPVWAGVVHAVSIQLELERVAERSVRMVRSLDWMTQKLSCTTSADELRKAVFEVGHLIAGETHDWWVLLSFQDVRLHV